MTDFDDRVLSLARRNIAVNRHLFRGENDDDDDDDDDVTVRPRRLDWLAPEHCCPLTAAPPASAVESSGGGSAYEWTRDDMAILRNQDGDEDSATTASTGGSIQLVLAADCIYDLTLVDGLFVKLRALLALHPAATCLLSLEKRYNFELESLSVQAHGYRTFLHHIGQHPPSPAHQQQDQEDQQGKHHSTEEEEEEEEEGTAVQLLQGRRIPLESLPQFFLGYERVSQLEMWEITAAQTR